MLVSFYAFYHSNLKQKMLYMGNLCIMPWPKIRNPIC